MIHAATGSFVSVLFTRNDLTNFLSKLLDIKALHFYKCKVGSEMEGKCA